MRISHIYDDEPGVNENRQVLCAILHRAQDRICKFEVIRISSVDHDIGGQSSFGNDRSIVFADPRAVKGLEAETFNLGDEFCRANERYKLG
jgi:hypothetical protein